MSQKGHGLGTLLGRNHAWVQVVNAVFTILQSCSFALWVSELLRRQNDIRKKAQD